MINAPNCDCYPNRPLQIVHQIELHFENGSLVGFDHLDNYQI